MNNTNRKLCPQQDAASQGFQDLPLPPQWPPHFIWGSLPLSIMELMAGYSLWLHPYLQPKKVVLWLNWEAPVGSWSTAVTGPVRSSSVNPREKKKSALAGLALMAWDGGGWSFSSTSLTLAAPVFFQNELLKLQCRDCMAQCSGTKVTPDSTHFLLHHKFLSFTCMQEK